MKEEKNLNIQSTTIEKGLDLAKDFLGKLISPTIEEIGLLAADQIKYIRFKNQVKILLKARTYVNEKNINIIEVPIKILVPLFVGNFCRLNFGAQTLIAGRRLGTGGLGNRCDCRGLPAHGPGGGRDRLHRHTARCVPCFVHLGQGVFQATHQVGP